MPDVSLWTTTVRRGRGEAARTKVTARFSGERLWVFPFHACGLSSHRVVDLPGFLEQDRQLGAVNPQEESVARDYIFAFFRRDER